MSTINRRTFIKGTTAGSLFVLTLAGCSEKKDTPAKSAQTQGTAAGLKQASAKPHYVMVFDQNKCVGCGECKEACAETNKTPAGVVPSGLRTPERKRTRNGLPVLRKNRALRLRTQICSCFLSAVSRCSLCSRLPDTGSSPRSGNQHRDDGSGQMRRLQILHRRLPVQRPLYQPSDPRCRKLRLLSAHQAR